MSARQPRSRVSSREPAQRRGHDRPGARLDEAAALRLVREALAEDLGSGDITTMAIVPEGARARGRLVAKEPIIVCGLPLAELVFHELDPGSRWTGDKEEGDFAQAGQTVASVEGSARALLAGERTALNFIQRLSGIATLARRAVEEVAGLGTVILDTRKTTPLLRALEKYAVRTGGGDNHRSGLYDGILIKDNHIALAGGVGEAVRRVAAAGHPRMAIVVEVDDPADLEEALAAGPGRILLDNLGPAEVARAVRAIAGRARIEVSGGLRPGHLRAYAEAGAEFLSLGSLTHSARAVDLSFEMEPLT